MAYVFSIFRRPPHFGNHEADTSLLPIQTIRDVHFLAGRAECQAGNQGGTSFHRIYSIIRSLYLRYNFEATIISYETLSSFSSHKILNFSIPLILSCRTTNDMDLCHLKWRADKILLTINSFMKQNCISLYHRKLEHPSIFNENSLWIVFI